MTSTVNRLRILVALAVLRSTPADQSFSSYILSLQDTFPSSSSTKTCDNPWKDHARQLEKECAELKAALRNLQIRSFLDVNTSSAEPPTQGMMPSSAESSHTAPAPPSKKKGKKKSDLNGEVENVNLAEVLKFGRPSQRSEGSFETLDTFIQLWSRHDRYDFPRKAFFAATRDVCKALSVSFDDATKDRTNLKSIQMLQAALCTLIDKAVPLVVSWTADDHEALSLLFNQLLDVFINPIIPSFLAVSERNLSYLRHADSNNSPSSSGSGKSTSPSRTSSDYVDGRVSILALLQTALSHVWSSLFVATPSQGPSIYDTIDPTVTIHADFSVMIHSLILVIFRHLRDIFREGNSVHKLKPTRRRRIKRLAVKDTFWYLCSATHFLLDLQNRTFTHLLFSDGTEKSRSEPLQETRLKLLRDAILDIMVDLVLYQDRKRADFAGGYNKFLDRTSVLQSAMATKDPSATCMPNTESDTEVINYLVLDDVGYRMLLRLVERFLKMDSIP